MSINSKYSVVMLFFMLLKIVEELSLPELADEE